MQSRFFVALTFCLGVSMLVVSPCPFPARGADWPRITLVLEQNNLSFPVHVTHAGDGSGRLFIAEQEGNIRILKNGVLFATPFLSIGGPGGRVSCCGERGFLSVAFPPDYSTKQHFYVYYTNLTGALVVARYQATANPDVADPNSEVILLTIPHPTYSNHNGGQLAFGPNDGYLYIGVGDGGGGGDPDNHAQDLLSLLGKILRIDVETNPGIAPYVVPDSNPYKNALTALPEIWAFGLRNPWRFSFDRLTGDLYIGDVGQNAYEEIDFQPAASSGGQNYGWRCREGLHDYEGHSAECKGRTLTKPVAEYAHGTDCAVTGGFRYRGAQNLQLRGIYFYGDFCSGEIRGLRRIGKKWTTTTLLDSVLNIASFGESEDGELYIADLNGALYKLTTTPSSPVDLTGSWAALASTCRAAGVGPRCIVQGSFLLQNQGIQKTPSPVLTKFYLSRDDVLSSDDVELWQRKTGRIAAGKTTTLSFRLNLPVGVTARNQFIIALVDATNAIAEIEENNNSVAFGPVQ